MVVFWYLYQEMEWPLPVEKLFATSPIPALYFRSTFRFFFPTYLFPFPAHALHTRACAFTERLFRHAIWEAVEAARGEPWTSGCCLVPTHVPLDFGAKLPCDFTLDAKVFGSDFDLFMTFDLDLWPDQSQNLIKCSPDNNPSSHQISCDSV